VISDDIRATVTYVMCHEEHLWKVSVLERVHLSNLRDVFWDVAPCSLVLILGVASTSETSVNFYQNILRCNPEDSHLLAYGSLCC
jgi:hypothetical protein